MISAPEMDLLSGRVAPETGELLELSIVMPCLNEADTIENCVRVALKALCDNKIKGEVVVADNGSTDGSRELAARLGARVVPVERKGYGSALQGGIAACRGEYVMMGDADESYDFAEAPKFLEKLRAGAGLVQGCRLPSGGGRVSPGAMPFTHRWLGNPGLTFLARLLYKVPIHDIYCGMRAFRKDLYNRLNMQCTGMEFATEMIIKASLRKERITEVPITLHPDGRKAHAPHLRTVRDGWRTLRFFLIYSPRWLFLLPGFFFLLAGGAGYLLGALNGQLNGVTFSAHSMLVFGVLILMGFNILTLGLVAKTFAINSRFLPPDPKLESFFKLATLERGLVLGSLQGISGLACIAKVFNQWAAHGFQALDYNETMPWVVTGALLLVLGTQMIFASFVVSLLGIRQR